MTNKKKSTSAKSDKDPATPVRKEGVRETIESIVIAFVFAFLFRTFEAEAFVIPTGSMAPTLFGRHKDVDCEQCGYHFHVGASNEVDHETQKFNPHLRIDYAHCPNCRFRNNIRDALVFTGDRILVNKFPYEIGDPQRWDVPVFKFPEGPETNFIKRCVGLPGETIRIRQGNLFAKKDDGKGWHILRKDNPDKQRAIQILVFDSDHRPVKLHEKGMPEFWAAVTKKETGSHIAGWAKDSNGWKANKQYNSFRLNAKQTEDDDFRWLRYRHFLPRNSDWNSLKSNEDHHFRPRLVTDYCSYNSYDFYVNKNREEETDGVFWNGELTLDAEFQISKVDKHGELLIELNQGAQKYRCRFDLKTGKTTLAYVSGLSREEDEQVLATTTTSVKGTGTYQISFANVDNRLCLWIDDSLVDFGNKKGEYPPWGGYDSLVLPEEADLIPVGIAAKGVDVMVSHMVLHRDIYYRGSFLSPQDQFSNHEPRIVYTEYDASNSTTIDSNLMHSHSSPAKYSQLYQRHVLWNDKSRQHISPSAYELKLDEGEYLMLGDNSPASSDSRLWRNTRRAKHRYAVPREAFVGKAFYIYWPHAVPFGNDGRGYTIFDHEKGSPEDKPYPSFTFPFYPNFKRMKRIR